MASEIRITADTVQATKAVDALTRTLERAGLSAADIAPQIDTVAVATGQAADAARQASAAGTEHRGVMESLQTSWVNAAAKLAVLRTAWQAVSSVAQQVHQHLMDSATYYDMVPTAAQRAAVITAAAITKGQIEPMALARSQNALVRGDLALTSEQFEILAKSAVVLADKVGGDAADALGALTRALVSGETRSLVEFGIQLELTGTKAEKSAKLLDYLRERYAGVTVEVTNYSDEVAQINNRLKLASLQAGASIDGTASAIARGMAVAKDALRHVVGDYTGLTQSSVQAAERALRKLEDEAKSAVRDATHATMAAFSAWTPDEGTAYIGALQRAVEAQRRARDLAQQVQSYVAQTGVAYDDLYGRIVDADDAQSWLNKHAAELNRLYEKNTNKIKELGNAIMANVLPAMQQWLAHTQDLPLPSVFGAVVRSLAAMAKSDKEIKDLQYTARLADEERARAAREWAEQRRKAAEEARKEELAWGRYYQSLARAEAEDARFWAELQAADDELRRKSEQEWQRLRKQENKIRDEAEKREEAARKKRESERQKEHKKEIERANERLRLIRSETEAISSVILQAATAEKSALEGLSRSDYILRALRDYMRGEALKYAAKSIGYAAEAAAALWLNPPAAPGLAKASALAAAAAAAFGAGAYAAGKLGGNNTGKSTTSSTASQSSSTSSRVGNVEQQRTSVTIVLGRGVIMGNPDDVARAMMAAISDAQRRGTARW